MKKTIAIIISALNEEKNIGLLLQDILDQKFSGSFTDTLEIKCIHVTSDGSTDQTAQIVKTFIDKDARIELVENPQRIGKIFSLNNAFNICQEDYAILFDADVRLESNTIEELLKPVISNSYDLVGGNPVPNKKPSLFNIAEQASYFSWLLVQKIKDSHPESIYSAHGRILLLSKNLYTNLHIDQLSTPGDDQYIYLHANHNFSYQKEAIVRYTMPTTTSDYLKQSVRFRVAKQMRTRNNEVLKIDKEFEIPGKFSLFLRCALRHPCHCFYWVLLYSIGFLKFLFVFKNKENINFKTAWGEVKSTK